MQILFFAGSLRADSLNQKYARAALRLAKELGYEGEFVDLKQLAIPLYDGDQEAALGVPQGVKTLGEKIAAADALVIAAPEYNGGISGVLKNTLDWLSRLSPMPLAGKSLLLIAASPGPMSGVRGLWHSRVPFEAVGVHVYPGMVGLGMAGAAFGADGQLTDEKKISQLRDTLAAFVKHAAT